MKNLNNEKPKVSNYVIQHFVDKYGTTFKSASYTWEDIEKTNVLSCIAVKKAVKNMCESGKISDGYHTFNELYRYRMLYNAAFFNSISNMSDLKVIKSKKDSTGQSCFGGGWFVVMATLPTGQISNHYEMKYWDLFNVDEVDKAYQWDGHTPQEAANRLEEYLKQMASI